MKAKNVTQSHIGKKNNFFQTEKEEYFDEVLF